jgi:hypothetical protein
VRSAIAAALIVASVAPVSAADVTLVGTDGRAALSEAEQAEISAVVKRKAESCSISSAVFPDIFVDRDAASEWVALEGRPHLYVRYETPVVIRRGSRQVLASEVLAGLDNPKFPRQPLTRHEGVVTMHAKCAGDVGIELMCLPVLRPYFEPAVLDNNCAILERVRPPS